MKKRITLLLLASLLTMPRLMAQTTRVRPVEFEIHVGASQAIDRMDYAKRSNGPVLGIELRYNIKNSPLDVGFLVDLTTAFYEFKDLEVETVDDYTVKTSFEQSNRTSMLGFTCDYNFRQGGTVNPFVGLGIGLGVHDALIDVVNDKNDCNNTAVVVPRVGVELWRHLRFTLSANLSCQYYNNLSLTVGCVFGGGKKL